MAFYALCFVCPIIMAILIYLHYNVSAMALLDLRLGDLVPINADFFLVYVGIQSSLAFLLTVLIGPVLVSRDLANNALPLYLCRPFTRAEYVVGKMSVLLILISSITWAPGLLLFFFHAYLKGGNWLAENLWLGWAIFMSSLVWMAVLALLSMSLSAWLKWRIVSSAALFAVFTIPSIVAVIVNELFRIPWGSLISLGALIQTITDGLFRQSGGDPKQLPLGVAWVVLGLFCAGCLALLSRKVRAYEVVR
jgi:hypothetical protein